MKKFILAFLFFVFSIFFVNNVEASTTCSFIDTGDMLILESDCITDETIYIPEGYTLMGNDYTISAEDPSGSHFVGAVVMNQGIVAHVTHLKVTSIDLANQCDSGGDRLRGIMFESASGSIAHSTVEGINQGASGCQEGNAIEIRNAPFDGTHPETVYVEVSHNNILDYQKTGIVANGDVDVDIHHNTVRDSSTQLNLAANSIQLGYGATGKVIHNSIEGNQWLGPSDWIGSAVLMYLVNDVEVSLNNIRGNSEIGIYIYGDRNIVNNNKVFDIGDDSATHEYDYGIGNWGSDNLVKNNKVKGFEVPYEGVTGGKNKSIPGNMMSSNVWF